MIMKTQIVHSRKILAFLGSLFLASLACNLPTRSEPDTQATMDAALSAVSANFAPTNTIPVSTAAAVPANTASVAPNPTHTPTLDQNSSLTATPSATLDSPPLATAASIENNVFAEDLLNRNHEITASSSTFGPRDFVYSAYLFINKRIDPLIEEPRTEICRLAIYRLDNGVNELLRSFTGPLYAPNNRYGYPAYCEAINWDAPSQNVVWGGGGG